MMMKRPRGLHKNLIFVVTENLLLRNRSLMLVMQQAIDDVFPDSQLREMVHCGSPPQSIPFKSVPSFGPLSEMKLEDQS